MNPVLCKNTICGFSQVMDKYQLLEDLFVAYFDARKHKRKTINQLRFEINFESNLIKLCNDLISGNYEIKKSICFVINQPVKREIFAADFRDRIVHHLLYNYINPIFEKSFIDDSYSCRKGKGTHYGIKRVEQFIKECSENYTKDCYILKLDISGYFMNINKEILFEKIKKALNNDLPDYEIIFYLLEKIIFNDPRKNCIIKGKRSDWDDLPKNKSLFYSPENCGLPIGNLTSQVFSNVYLDDFDKFVRDKLGVKYYGRYVDDFVLIHPDKVFLLSVKEEIKDYLRENCHLILHPKKIYLQHYAKGVAFLGAYIKPYRTYVGKRSKRNFFLTIKECDKLLDSDSPCHNNLKRVRASLNSYLGIMQHYRTYNIRREALLGKPHEFLKYGYLDGKLTKYSVSKKFLKIDI